MFSSWLNIILNFRSLLWLFSKLSQRISYILHAFRIREMLAFDTVRATFLILGSPTVTRSLGIISLIQLRKHRARSPMVDLKDFYGILAPRRWVKGNLTVPWRRGTNTAVDCFTRLLAGRYRAAEGTCSALWFYYLFGSEISNSLEFKFGRSMIEGSETLGAWIILASVISQTLSSRSKMG